MLYLNPFRHWKMAIPSGFFFMLLSLSLFFPLFSSSDPNAFDPNVFNEPQAPSKAHIFGTDDLGRDIFIRAVYGARISLAVAFLSVVVAISIRTMFGLIAGYRGGYIDNLMMRFVDFLMALPTLFLILIIQILVKPSIWNVMIVIGITSWMGVSRLVRAEVMSMKERPFILAAHARGFSHRRVLFKHILPHTLPPIIVAATLGTGNAILMESVLSFLGLGVQPPHPSWGNMLDNSLSYMREAPWMTIIPGVCVTITVLALQILGDGLRAFLNPKE